MLAVVAESFSMRAAALAGADASVVRSVNLVFFAARSSAESMVVVVVVVAVAVEEEAVPAAVVAAPVVAQEAVAGEGVRNRCTVEWLPSESCLLLLVLILYFLVLLLDRCIGR